MRFLVRTRKAGELEIGLIYGAIAFIAVGAARFLPLRELVPACVFRSLSGVPCPTCGSTRSLVHFSHGELAMAFSQNPLFAMILILILVYSFVSGIAALLKLPRLVFLLSPLERNLMSVGAFLLIAANWIYLISRS